jgi:hypothetical protein
VEDFRADAEREVEAWDLEDGRELRDARLSPEHRDVPGVCLLEPTDEGGLVDMGFVLSEVGQVRVVALSVDELVDGDVIDEEVGWGCGIEGKDGEVVVLRLSDVEAGKMAVGARAASVVTEEAGL